MNLLITGANSYIGTQFEAWLIPFKETYQVETLDMKGEEWKKADFGRYDAILHVAGIAHIKETKENEALYYRVNRDLAIEVAQKAKAEGVKHFVLLSTMSVYGLEESIITANTPCKPTSAYGKSKLEAEQQISDLHGEHFVVSILRPPMVYGKGCKGNYPKLAKMALKTPVFPAVKNQRSMIHIDNLSEFIRLLLEERSEGLFFPQNTNYVCTADMVKKIAALHGRKVILVKGFGSILTATNVGVMKKVFGNLVYEQALSNFERPYNVRDFEASLRASEQDSLAS